MATQPSEEERQVGNERPPQNSNSENELADSSDREDYFFKTLIDSSDSDFDDAAREEIDRYDKMMNETQGFGVTFRPDYPFLGGVYPIDLNIEPERAELVRQHTLYAIDHHNRTKDGSLQFVDLLHATYGPTGGETRRSLASHLQICVRFPQQIARTYHVDDRITDPAMVQFKDFKVVVRINGQPLPEYETENDDPSATNTITRYVEARSGAKFDIDCQYVGGKRLPGPRSIIGVGYKPRIDGKSIRSEQSDVYPFYGTKVQRILRIKDGKSYARELMFADLNIVEEMHHHNSSTTFNALRDTLRDVGTLEIGIFRYTQKVRSTGRSGNGLQLPMSHQSSGVPEKALKGDAKSHFVGLGEEKPHHTEYVHLDYYDATPFLIFRFKYRSHQALEQLHIVSRAPAPPSADIASLSREELVRLVETQREQIQSQTQSDQKIKTESSQAGGHHIKRRRGKDDEGNDDDVIATESRPVRTRRADPTDWANAQVVDLTED